MRDSKPKSLKRGVDNSSRKRPRSNYSRNMRVNPKATYNPRSAKRNIIPIVVIILLVIVISSIVFNGAADDNKSEISSVKIGSNDIGNVIREGPYGNPDADSKIAIIIGTHPRESGAHKQIYKALKDYSDNFSSCFYIYKINVTANSVDYGESRMNGQILARDFVVNDIVKNNFTVALDAHYSNGAWNVARFVFTPVESNNVSYSLAKDMANTFYWIDYYNPGSQASSPQYVTTPLNEKGVPAIVYEAYAEDVISDTYSHAVSVLKYLDSYFIDENRKNT